MKKLVIFFFVNFTALSPHILSSDIEGKVSYFSINLRDAAVYIAKIEGKTFSPPQEPVVLNQVGLSFIPHVLPILVGTTVNFPNEDVVLHNVFSPGYLGKFNLGTYPMNASKQKTFDEPGIVLLLCNIHHEMSAFILVIETPYVAVTDQNGIYKISNIPPGRYRLSVWHEGMKPQTKEIDLPEHNSIRVNFTLQKK
jgi:plastocyanin